MSIGSSILEFITGFSDIIFKKEDNIGQEQNIPEQKYQPEQITPKKYSFRPRNLDEYIGQENAKELTKLNLQKIINGKASHFIISGTKGTGKSTLAYIIANHLGFKIHTYIGGAFTFDNLNKFLIDNEQSQIPNILFVDEIHGIDVSLGEFLYPILEDFLMPESNVNLRNFIFIGATTEKNVLQKKLSPLLDRCQANINLEHYNSDDIAKIIKQYNQQVYNKTIPEEIYKIIGLNSRYTPRIAIGLFDDYMVTNNMDKVLKAHRIIKNSLTTDDILVLRHLAEINKAVGVEVLAIITQQTKQDYMALQEPFLISDGYLSRSSRGRGITEKGKQLLEELK